VSGDIAILAPFLAFLFPVHSTMPGFGPPSSRQADFLESLTKWPLKQVGSNIISLAPQAQISQNPKTSVQSFYGGLFIVRLVVSMLVSASTSIHYLCCVYHLFMSVVFLSFFVCGGVRLDVFYTDCAFGVAS
jgi:hypothetical protein